MKNKTQNAIVNIICLLIIGIVLLFTIVRLFYGVELTDEAYAVAETYMVSKGALPFVNNWSQMPGFTLLLAPFVKIYTTIAGGTDGIFLFFRSLSFFINLITAMVIAYLLKDYVKNRVLSLLLVMIYVGATGWDYVMAFRGDRLSIDLSAIGAWLLATFFSEHREKAIKPFISGLLLALSVLSYPTYAIVFAICVMVIVVLCFKKKKEYKILLWFLAGATIATVIVLGFLAIKSSFSDIFQGIQYIFKDVTYFQLQNDEEAKLISYIKDMMGQMLLFIILSVVCFFCYWIISIVYFKKRVPKINQDCYAIKHISVNRLLLISLISGVCLYELYQIWRFKTGDHTYISLYTMTIETLAVPLIWPFVRSKKQICSYLMVFIWIPTFIWVVITGIGTYASMLGRHSLLKNAAFLLGVFVVFAVHDNFNAFRGMNEVSEKKFYAIHVILTKMIPVFLMMIITWTNLFNSYTYVYRDESIGQLDTVVSEGPYRGMRTTATRAKGLIEIDNIIDEYISKEDYVLAMDNDPFIYLMSNGYICTPCTWDQALYSYGFDQPDLYYDYFSVTNTEPTKIIYFNFGRDEIMSIDVEYKFNDYVYANYDLLYEDRDIFAWLYCGKDTVCEFLIFDRKDETRRTRDAIGMTEKITRLYRKLDL